MTPKVNLTFDFNLKKEKKSTYLMTSKVTVTFVVGLT